MLGLIENTKMIKWVRTLEDGMKLIKDPEVANRIREEEIEEEEDEEGNWREEECLQTLRGNR